MHDHVIWLLFIQCDFRNKERDAVIGLDQCRCVPGRLFYAESGIRISYVRHTADAYSTVQRLLTNINRHSKL